MRPILYMAPLLGITNYIYRSVYSECFKGFDLAVSPFISKGNFEKKGKASKNEILPENNKNLPVVLQVLTNKSDELISQAKIVHSAGGSTINWNLGCPYPRVVNKKRGAGLLPFSDEIKKILDKVIPVLPVKLSIKTRLGIDSPDALKKLMMIFNDYPLQEIIIHPRTAAQMYEGVVDIDTFEECLVESKNEVVYNGDIFTQNDYKKLQSKFPKVSKWMIGRGSLINPLLPEKIKDENTSEKLNIEEMLRIKNFILKITDAYKLYFSSDKHVLDKMKELISYQIKIFSDKEKILKKIKKTDSVQEFISLINLLFGNPAD